MVGADFESALIEILTRAADRAPLFERIWR